MTLADKNIKLVESCEALDAPARLGLPAFVNIDCIDTEDCIAKQTATTSCTHYLVTLLVFNPLVRISRISDIKSSIDSCHDIDMLPTRWESRTVLFGHAKRHADLGCLLRYQDSWE